MDGVLAWLTGLPAATLYAALGLTAAIENVFPPLPADTVVAFGSFLAARGEASIWFAFLATWVGNVGGAMLMYGLGRRYGAERMLKRLGGEEGQARLQRLYARHGIWALALSRFVPGARAIVPPFAGALRIPALQATLAIALASAVWYGAITWLAYTVGGNWDTLMERMRDLGRWSAIGAAAILALGGLVWLVRRRRHSTPAGTA